MKYEKTPIRGRAKRKFALKVTTDMDKLSSFNIVRYLYRRHDRDVWITACWLSWALILYIKLG